MVGSLQALRTGPSPIIIKPNQEVREAMYSGISYSPAEYTSSEMLAQVYLVVWSARLRSD
ncbi:MAG: hypothetical protein R3Y11_04540 [Pseudomonadota bacterium]